jgi:hypothetical protein
MAQARIGFKPLRTPDTRYVRNVAVSAGGTPVAIGDAVSMVGGKVTALGAGQDPSNGKGYGVVIAVYTSTNRPLTFNSTKFIASGSDGRADVCWDPDMTFLVQCISSIGTSDFGKNLNIDASAANATTGISGMSIQIPASASLNDPFKLIGLAPFEELGGKQVAAPANSGVEVAWNNHFLRAPVAAQ